MKFFHYFQLFSTIISWYVARKCQKKFRLNHFFSKSDGEKVKSNQK